MEGEGSLEQVGCGRWRELRVEDKRAEVQPGLWDRDMVWCRGSGDGFLREGQIRQWEELQLLSVTQLKVFKKTKKKGLTWGVMS